MARKTDTDGFDEYGNLDDPTQQWWNPPSPLVKADATVDTQPLPRTTAGQDGINITPTAPSTPLGTPGTYQTGSPNDPNKDAGGDADVRAYIAQLAAMPGADPSLASNPDYWVGAINSRGGLNAGNRQYWQDASVGPSAFFNNPNREGGGAAAPAAAGGGGGDLRSLLTSLLSSNRQPAANPQRDALYSRISALMDKYSQPVTADDPDIHNASDAYQGDIQRSLAQFRELAAERAHAQGVPTGAFDAQIGNATQAGGRAAGQFTTDLIGRETQSRRSALAAAMGQGASVLDSGDTNDFRNRSLDLSSILGQENVDNQDSQFYDKLTSDTSSHANDLDTILQELLLNPA